jgi:hypothetical protein
MMRKKLTSKILPPIPEMGLTSAAGIKNTPRGDLDK